jgi:hypothetical protein
LLANCRGTTHWDMTLHILRYLLVDRAWGLCGVRATPLRQSCSGQRLRTLQSDDHLDKYKTLKILIRSFSAYDRVVPRTAKALTCDPSSEGKSLSATR